MKMCVWFQTFWLSPISFSVLTKLLQAPSGHACKGCWPVRHRIVQMQAKPILRYLYQFIRMYWFVVKTFFKKVKKIKDEDRLWRNTPGFPRTREWHTHTTNPLLCHSGRSEAQTRNPGVLLQSWTSNNIWFWIWIKSGNSKSYVHRSPKGLTQR